MLRGFVLKHVFTFLLSCAVFCSLWAALSLGYGERTARISSTVYITTRVLEEGAATKSEQGGAREPHLFPQTWAQQQMLLSLESRGIEKWPNNSWHRCHRKPQTYYFDRLNVIYTGIPKSGCSNWLEALCKADGRTINKYKQPVYWVHGNITKRDRMVHIEDTKLATLGDVFSFTILRNPWTRLVSGYRDKISGETNVGPRMTGLGKHLLRKMEHLSDDEAEMIGDRYMDFEAFVDLIIKSNGGGNMHFRHQYFTLCLPEAGYDYIGALEYSHLHEKEIFKMLNKSVSLSGSYDEAHDIRNATTTLKAKEMFGELPPDKVEKLYKIFEPDFLILNYSNFTDPNFPLPLYYGASD